MDDQEIRTPVRNMNEFIHRDNIEQSKFNDGEQSHDELLNGNEWPRVEELDVDQQDSDQDQVLEGIVSPGTKELQLLSEFVCRISASLRLDSQNETIDLVSKEVVHGNDVFITNLPKQFEEKFSSHIHNSKIVEVTVFPGLEADSTKLPNDVLIGDIILAAVRKFQNSTRKIPRKWIKLFCSKSSCQLVSDAFWFIWHHRFNSDNQVEQKLLQRISNVIVGFLVNCKLSSKSKDEFFKLYPNIISIVVWNGFMESFPKSQKHFELPFQTMICDHLAEWIMGIVPVYPWCLEWNTLKSKVVKAEAAKVDSAVVAANTANPEVIMFSSKNVSNDKLERKDRESCKIGPSQTITKEKFDVYQNSPIISKYLKTAGFHKCHGSLIVHRSQVIRQISGPNIPTYRQIINESIKNASNYFQEYKGKIKEASREKLSIIQETNSYLCKEEIQQKKIMNNPNLIKDKAHSVLQEMAESAKMHKKKILANRKKTF